jgi:hypothetical protein
MQFLNGSTSLLHRKGLKKERKKKVTKPSKKYQIGIK